MLDWPGSGLFDEPARAHDLTACDAACLQLATELQAPPATLLPRQVVAAAV